MHLIHRGIVSKKYHENLLKSFEQSFKKGFGIETDIHATKDNEFICFHDFTLTRIFKRKESVKNLSYLQIKNISEKQKKGEVETTESHLRWKTSSPTGTFQAD